MATYLPCFTILLFPIKRPWALEIHGSKNGDGRLHGEAICTYTRTIGSSKNGVGAYTEMGAYSGEYGNVYWFIVLDHNTVAPALSLVYKCCGFR